MARAGKPAGGESSAWDQTEIDPLGTGVHMRVADLWQIEEPTGPV